MNSTKQVLSLAKLAARSASTAVEVPTPRFQRLKELQKRLQIEDGTPVYIKSGFKDKVLLMVTTGLTAVGMGLSFRTLYQITYKD